MCPPPGIHSLTPHFYFYSHKNIFDSLTVFLSSVYLILSWSDFSYINKQEWVLYLSWTLFIIFTLLPHLCFILLMLYYTNVWNLHLSSSTTSLRTMDFIFFLLLYPIDYLVLGIVDIQWKYIDLLKNSHNIKLWVYYEYIILLLIIIIYNIIMIFFLFFSKRKYGFMEMILVVCNVLKMIDVQI